MLNQPIEKFINSKAAAEFLGVCPKTLRRYVYEENLPFYSLSKKGHRFLLSEIFKWMKKRKM